MTCIDLEKEVYLGFEAHLSAIDDEKVKLRLFTTVKTISLDKKPELKIETQHERKDVSKYLERGDKPSNYLLNQIEQHLYGMGYEGRVVLECADGPLEFVNVVGPVFNYFVKTKKRKE